MRRIWPKTVKIYWDPWRNIPVIRPTQEEIELYYQLKLTEPGDARPAFAGDLARLRNAILREFGSDKLFQRFFSNNLVLLNKVPHWDIMYEVIASGNVLGQLYYDPFNTEWRFKLTYPGAYIALNENLVEYLSIDMPIYTGKVISTSKSIGVNQVVVLDKKGNIRGIGEVIEDKVIISKTFHDRTPPVETSNKPANMYDAVKRNGKGLSMLEDRSIKFLKKIASKYPLPLTVSFSGGKDSLVALDLACKAIGDVQLVFNDTGLELPQTLENVETVATRYGLKLHIALAGDIFWKAIEVFGPPGKDYRWCCKITKLLPIAKLMRAICPMGGLNVVGQRAYESLDRSKSPLVWRNRWIPHMVSTTPIQHWGQLECWLYIFRYRLPYNKLYEHGFDRLGCYLCPSSALAEFKDIEKMFPDLWQKWIEVLEKWRQKLNLPRSWIDLGLWRWLTPASAKRRITRHLPDHNISWQSEYMRRLDGSIVNLTPIEKINENDVLKLKFNSNIIRSIDIMNVVMSNLEKLGYKVEIDGDSLTIISSHSKIKIKGDIIEFSPYNLSDAFEDMVEVIKVIYRSYGCVKCGSCFIWTPSGKVRFTQHGPVLQNSLDEKAKRIYLEICPISDQLVEKIVVALITGDPKAFKRKTKRHVLSGYGDA
ncbi:MAG: phosphoadenosine phosphosulfate reductase family protein [Desulfurococcaceae archaeon]